MLEFRFQIATDILKMLGTSLFHLNLDSTVLRIHIVEEFLAGLAGVGLDLVVKIFIDVDKASPLGDFEAQVIEAGIFIVNVHSGDGFLQRGGSVDQHRAEIEVIAERALLAVDHRSEGAVAVHLVEMVGIDHGGGGILGD